MSPKPPPPTRDLQNLARCGALVPLNLVLDDGSRINVVDHGCARSLRAEAHQLATFLDKPLWDATGPG